MDGGLRLGAASVCKMRKHAKINGDIQATGHSDIALKHCTKETRSSHCLR